MTNIVNISQNKDFCIEKISNVILLIFFSVFLSAAMIITVNTPLNQAGSLDPYVYSGYIYDFNQIIQRYGQTYYSSRVAYIFLEQFFAKLFGVNIGYYICRIFILSIATLAVFCVGYRFYGKRTAIFAAVFLNFLPWLTRSVLWTHYDGFAAIYLLIGISLLIVPQRWVLLGHFAGGIAYALAVNCNMLLLALGASFFPSWIILNYHHGWMWLSRHIASIMAGFVFTYWFLLISYKSNFSSASWFLEAGALSMSKSLLSGGGNNWFISFSDFYKFKLYIIFIPITIFLALLSNLLRSNIILLFQQRFAFSVAVYLVINLTIGFILHLAFNIANLSLFYYLVYYVVPCIFGLIVLLGEWEKTGTLTGKSFPFVSAIFIIINWFRGQWFHDWMTSLSVWPWLALMFVAGASIFITKEFRLPISASAAFLVTFCVYSSYNDSTYARLSGCFRGACSLETDNKNRLEWDVLHGAQFLLNFVGHNISSNSKIGFWYSNQPDHWLLNSVQSSYLWGYSRIAKVPSKDKLVDLGMPYIDHEIRDNILSRSAIVLLGFSNNELDRGIEALNKNRIHVTELKRAVFDGNNWSFYMALAEVEENLSPSISIIEQISLESIKPLEGSRLQIISSVLNFSSANCQWCYSAYFYIPNETYVQGRSYGLRFRMRVDQGIVGLAVAGIHNESKIIIEKSINESKTEKVFDLILPKGENQLILRNQSSSGESKGKIMSIELFYVP